MATDILKPFEYDDSEQRIVIEQRFSEAQGLMRQGLVNMIDAGGKFAEIRDMLRHNKRGGFDGWIDAKQLGRRTVYKVIELHSVFSSVQHVAQLDIATTAAYLLASPGTPDEARQEALERAAAGEKIGVSTAKTVILQHKPIGGTPADPNAFATPAQLQGAVRSWLGQFGASVRVHILAQIALQNDVGRDRLLLLGEYAKSMGLRGLLGDLKKACAVVAAEQGSGVRRQEAGDGEQESGVRGQEVEDEAEPAERPEPERGRAEGTGRETRCRICNRVLDDPDSVAKGYGPECAEKARASGSQGSGVRGQGSGGGGQGSGDGSGLVATVEAWLAALVENAELADDADGRRTVLYAVAHRRQNGGAPLWASLRKFAGDGAVVSTETQRELLAAVRVLLGEEEPNAEERMQNAERGNGETGAPGRVSAKVAAGKVAEAMTIVPGGGSTLRPGPNRAEIAESARLLGVLRRARADAVELRDGLLTYAASLPEYEAEDDPSATGALVELLHAAEKLVQLLEAV
jgi:hypothetical protein